MNVAAWADKPGAGTKQSDVGDPVGAPTTDVTSNGTRTATKQMVTFTSANGKVVAQTVWVSTATGPAGTAPQNPEISVQSHTKANNRDMRRFVRKNVPKGNP